jgi:hypothetical protein
MTYRSLPRGPTWLYTGPFENTLEGRSPLPDVYQHGHAKSNILHPGHTFKDKHTHQTGMAYLCDTRYNLCVRLGMRLVAVTQSSPCNHNPSSWVILHHVGPCADTCGLSSTTDSRSTCSPGGISGIGSVGPRAGTCGLGCLAGHSSNCILVHCVKVIWAMWVHV